MRFETLVNTKDYSNSRFSLKLGKKVTVAFVVLGVEQMKNETTTKANPVKPNTSSKLNIEHKGICQASEVVQVHYSGDSGSVSTNQKNLADEQNKHLACSQTAGNKPAQHN